MEKANMINVLREQVKHAIDEWKFQDAIVLLNAIIVLEEKG